MLSRPSPFFLSGCPVSRSLPLTHILLATAITAVWGTNFVVMRIGLNHFPPLLFAALRFVFVFLPAAFFLKRPKVPILQLVAYGLLVGAGQFGILYFAISGHITPGLASLIVQTQVFFTIGLAILIEGDKVKAAQWLALVLAVAGIVVIGLHSERGTTLLGIVMVLAAAASWAGSNAVARRAGPVNHLAYVVWSALFSFPPLFLVSWIFEGWPTMSDAVMTASPAIWLTVLWQSVGNTLFGYTAWVWLLSRYQPATIAPMSLLVPVFGMSASSLLLGEPLPGWKVLAAGLVMGGLALNMLWPRFVRTDA